MIRGIRKLTLLLSLFSLLPCLSACAKYQQPQSGLPMPPQETQPPFIPAETFFQAFPLAVASSEIESLPPETEPQPETKPLPETESQPETEPLPETEPQPEQFLITLVGDCTFGTHPWIYYSELGYIKTIGDDYKYPFRNVVKYFENDDLTLANLEGPLTDEGFPMQKAHPFHGPTAFVNILTENSVEAVSLANNHTMDYFQTGYDNTLSTLQSAGVSYVEQNSTVLLELEGGLTVGIYAMWYTLMDVNDMTQAIADMKAQGADFIIVAAHWGVEGFYYPSDEQIWLGHAAIDAGANLVWGSHPHVLQPIEEYRGGIICYSLGNFSFGGNTAPGDFDTALIQQTVLRYPDGTVALGDTTAIPASISSQEKVNNYQPTPYPANSLEYSRVMQKLGLS